MFKNSQMKFFFISLTLISLHASAQSTDSVKAVINKMFTGMRNVDTEMLKTCFADSAVFQTVAVSKEGKVSVRNESVAGFLNSIGKQQPGMLDERITFEGVHIDGNLASVFTPYRFYFNNRFSHCGANAFQLVRLDGVWKIQYIIDTRRKENCE
jgi:hypothetical protein